VGAQLGDEIEPLTGSTAALVIGLAGALWAGLGVTLALGRAFDQIWDVPRLEQRGGVGARVRGLAVLAVIGSGLIASTVLAGFTLGGRIGEGAEQAGALAGVLAVNVVALFAVFALLTGRPVRVRELLPGVAVAAVGTLLLQSLGSWYVDLAVTRASDTYGTFALVIGLLSWFLLLSHLMLIAAELNVVLHRRLWPRSLVGTLTPADRLALERSARAAQRDERQRIAVSFAEGGARHPGRTQDGPIAAAAGRTEDAHSPSADRETPSMSTLVAIAYPDVATAEQVRAELVAATKEHLLQLEDAVVVEHQQDGKIKLHQAMGTTGAGAAGGALWGGLIGLIFLAPLLGMAVGAASGAVAGKMTDVGVDDSFMKDLGTKLQPGGAALIALGSTEARDKLLDRIKGYGGDVLQTSLDRESEEHLRAALSNREAVA
jgi:uncharacterized membrane protein/uncharacterized BrkB/YihY/UPF0761 family membrane protein